MKKPWEKKSSARRFRLWPINLCLPLTFMDLAAETRKDYTKYAGKVLPVLGRLTLIKLNLNTSGAIWISVAWPVNAGQPGKEFSFAGIPLGL
jgi:hypothetical protein